MNDLLEPLPVHPFEQFPRAELLLGMDRRQFFWTLWKEFELLGKRPQGAQAYKLGALGSLSDEALGPLVPRMLQAAGSRGRTASCGPRRTTGRRPRFFAPMSWRWRLST